MIALMNFIYRMRGSYTVYSVHVHIYWILYFLDSSEIGSLRTVSRLVLKEIRVSPKVISWHQVCFRLRHIFFFVNLICHLRNVFGLRLIILIRIALKCVVNFLITVNIRRSLMIGHYMMRSKFLKLNILKLSGLLFDYFRKDMIASWLIVEWRVRDFQRYWVAL